MKPVSITHIKRELHHLSQEELMTLLLRVGKYKVENKELLTYLLFEENNEDGYVDAIKDYIDTEFDGMKQQTYYYIKKSTRKILRMVKKYIKFSKKPETEAALLIHFCRRLQHIDPNRSSSVLGNMFYRQMELAKKTVSKMHEDLQYDYTLEINDITAGEV